MVYSSLEDIENLVHIAAENDRLEGVIVGRAFLSGAVDVAKAVKACL